MGAEKCTYTPDNTPTPTLALAPEERKARVAAMMGGAAKAKCAERAIATAEQKDATSLNSYAMIIQNQLELINCGRTDTASQAIADIIPTLAKEIAKIMCEKRGEYDPQNQGVFLNTVVERLRQTQNTSTGGMLAKLIPTAPLVSRINEVIKANEPLLQKTI